jgi:uncharacterized membrane protein
MDSNLWAKAHGATTHFPLALALCSAVCDAAGFALERKPIGSELRAAGYWTMILGALGTVPAVASGLLMTKGAVLGHDSLRLHHLFVWPAFALLIALGTWRALQGRSATPSRIFAGYLILAGVAAGLMTAAAYWGGEMMLAAR